MNKIYHYFGLLLYRFKSSYPPVYEAFNSIIDQSDINIDSTIVVIDVNINSAIHQNDINMESKITI